MQTVLRAYATLFSCSRVSNYFLLCLFTFPPLSLQTAVKDFHSKYCKTDGRKLRDSNYWHANIPASLSRYFKQSWHRFILHSFLFLWNKEVIIKELLSAMFFSYTTSKSSSHSQYSQVASRHILFLLTTNSLKISHIWKMRLMVG